MITLHTQFIVDGRGRTRAVQLPVREYRKLVDLVEDFDDIAYLKAHRHEKLVPMAKVHASLKRAGLV